jgi:hypothetical protein
VDECGPDQRKKDHVDKSIDDLVYGDGEPEPDETRQGNPGRPQLEYQMADEPISTEDETSADADDEYPAGRRDRDEPAG